MQSCPEGAATRISESHFDIEKEPAEEVDAGFAGEFLPALLPSVPKEKKIGRNAPCPCGSGEKHKKCCLDNQPLDPFSNG